MNENHEVVEMVEHILGDKEIVKCHMTHLKSVKIKGGKKYYLHDRVTMLTTDSVVTICRKYVQYHQLLKEAFISQGGQDTDYSAPGERRWGKHINDGPYIEHEDQLYLQLIIDKVGQREWLVDNRTATAEEVADIEAMRYATPVSANPQPLRLAAMSVDSIITLSVIEEQS